MRIGQHPVPHPYIARSRTAIIVPHYAPTSVRGLASTSATEPLRRRPAAGQTEKSGSHGWQDQAPAMACP